MIEFKRYGCQKKCLQKWRGEKENCCYLIDFQLKNKLHSVMQTSFLVLRQEDHTPNLKRCHQIYSECDTVFGIVSKCMNYTKTAITDRICWLPPYHWHSNIRKSFPFFLFTLTWWNSNYILYVEPTFILMSK